MRPGANARADFARVKGILGTLIAARWYRSGQNDRSLVSLDRPEAREHCMGMGVDQARNDGAAPQVQPIQAGELGLHLDELPTAAIRSPWTATAPSLNTRPILVSGDNGCVDQQNVHSRPPVCLCDTSSTFAGIIQFSQRRCLDEREKDVIMMIGDGDGSKGPYLLLFLIGLSKATKNEGANVAPISSMLYRSRPRWSSRSTVLVFALRLRSASSGWTLCWF